MIEFNLLSVWVPIVVTVIVFVIWLWIMKQDDNDIPLGNLLIFPAGLFVMAMIWVIWFILREIFK
jgi:hypothetical protein